MYTSLSLCSLLSPFGTLDFVNNNYVQICKKTFCSTGWLDGKARLRFTGPLSCSPDISAVLSDLLSGEVRCPPADVPTALHNRGSVSGHSAIAHWLTDWLTHWMTAAQALAPWQTRCCQWLLAVKPFVASFVTRTSVESLPPRSSSLLGSTHLPTSAALDWVVSTLLGQLMALCMLCWRCCWMGIIVRYVQR